MFARTVTIRLRSESVAEFNRTLENNILPLLRNQKGFREEITLVNGTEVVGISLPRTVHGTRRGSKPGVEVSTINAETPLCFCSGLVFA